MPDALIPEASPWEILIQGTVVYVLVAMILRLIPKRHTGNLSPNDLVAIIIVGSLAADAIVGETHSTIDVLLMIGVVLLWDYLFNVLEFYAPWFRRVAQHTPTLLVHDGEIIRKNMRSEMLTDEELMSNLRKHGVTDVAQVREAILEGDGHISVIKKEPGQ